MDTSNIAQCLHNQSWETMMETNMEPKGRGGLRCVAGTLDNQSCSNNSKTKGINLHRFPKDPKICRQWTKFVRKRRPNFDPTDYSNPVLCSEHFQASCYAKRLANQLEGFDAARTKRFLQREAVPTVYVASASNEEKSMSPSKRERRKVSFLIHSLANSSKLNNISTVADSI